MWKLVAVAVKERKAKKRLVLVPCWAPFDPKPFSHQFPRHHGCWSFDQTDESHDLGQMESQNAAVSVMQLTSLCDDQFVTLFLLGSFVLFGRLVGLTPSSGCCPQVLVYGQQECLSAWWMPDYHRLVWKSNTTCMCKRAMVKSVQTLCLVTYIVTVSVLTSGFRPELEFAAAHKSNVRTNVGKQSISYIAIDIGKDLPPFFLKTQVCLHFQSK